MIDFKVGTIFGANVGFEIISGADFASIEHEALWAVMLNLFCVRITVTKWPNEDES